MKIRTITTLGLLTGVALVLGYIEHMLPIAPTLPGIKLGLSNTVLLYAIYMLGKKNAFTLMQLKVLLSGVLFAGLNGAIYSFSGGLLSLIMMYLIIRVPGVSILGVSVIGAVFHNVGQILIASVIVESRAIFMYLPALLVSAVVTGILTGITAKYVLKGLSAKSSGLPLN